MGQREVGLEVEAGGGRAGVRGTPGVISPWCARPTPQRISLATH